MPHRKLVEALQLSRASRTAQREFEGGADILGAGGEKFRLPDNEWIIERGESLQRSKRGVAARGEEIRIGGVKAVHKWIGHAADNMPIDATTGIHLAAAVIINGRVILLEIKIPNR